MAGVSLRRGLVLLETFSKRMRFSALNGLGPLVAIQCEKCKGLPREAGLGVGLSLLSREGLGSAGGTGVEAPSRMDTDNLRSDA